MATPRTRRLVNTGDASAHLNAAQRGRRRLQKEAIKLTRELMGDRMYPLTISGLDDGIKRLH